MFFQFGSRKVSKFMTANQKHMFLTKKQYFQHFNNILHVKYCKNVEKCCKILFFNKKYFFLIRSHGFTHFLTPKLKKHVF